MNYIQFGVFILCCISSFICSMQMQEYKQLPIIGIDEETIFWGKRDNTGKMKGFHSTTLSDLTLFYIIVSIDQVGTHNTYHAHWHYIKPCHKFPKKVYHSSFFPDEWNKKKVFQKIKEAHNHIYKMQNNKDKTITTWGFTEEQIPIKSIIKKRARGFYVLTAHPELKITQLKKHKLPKPWFSINALHNAFVPYRRVSALMGMNQEKTEST